MSTLQVANIFFDSLGNNKIVYQNNTIKFLINAQETFSDTRISQAISAVKDAVGSYKFSYNSTLPTDYITVTNNAINISSYPVLGAILNVNPYRDNFGSIGSVWDSATGASSYFYALEYGNGIYVAVGAIGSIQTSTDGITWTNATSANTNAQTGVAYGNGVFVSVGSAGSIQSSINGTTWTNRTTANTNDRSAVAYGNGVFVSVGGAGSIITSINGTNWTNRTTANTQLQLGVAYGNGVFVSAGVAGSIQSSINGTTWTNRTTANTNDINHVAYGNGIFVTVGLNGAITTSPDGINWTNRTTANTNQQLSVAYGNGIFVSLGDNFSVQTSPNGITWTDRSNFSSLFYYGIAYNDNDGVFVAVGSPQSVKIAKAQIAYDTTTQFKTPPFNKKFNGYDNGYGKSVYIYMKT